MKANATLQLDRFLAETCCPTGRRTLRINMDESSIRLWPGAVKGTIATKNMLQNTKELVCNISLRRQRGYASLIAIICDDAMIQKHLPQFLIVNERHLPMKMFREWTNSTTHSLIVIRHHTAWLDAKRLTAILRILAQRLTEHAPNRHYVLSMDTCPTHLTRTTLRAMARNLLHFCPLAAHMTQWLQPLDVGVFQPFKHKLRELHQREQILQRQSELTVDTVLTIIEEATKETILMTDWSGVFEMCGLSACPPTSRRFMHALGMNEEWTFTNAVPTLEHIQAVLPNKKFVAIADLFQLVMRPHVKHALEPHDALEHDFQTTQETMGAHAASHRPWWGRTRATSRADISQPLVPEHTSSQNKSNRVRAVPIATPRPVVPR